VIVFSWQIKQKKNPPNQTKTDVQNKNLINQSQKPHDK
jgi:hypothetical protein